MDVVPAASLDPRVVEEAGRLYREAFDAGDDGT
ncbi:Uncharacterised protein [Mycobacteroides abscessus]|nr:Uncharacterised protein [Mycobacteroides abscessus]